MRSCIRFQARGRRVRKACLAALGAVLLFGFARPAAGQRIDRAWFEGQLRGDLERYLKVAPQPNGFLRPSYDRQWRPRERQHATAVSQTRLIFVMAAGYEVTRRDDYREAARRGADFLLAHFRDPEHGGYFRRVSPAGEVQDDTKDSYSHAFAIFGLVQAWRATGDARYREAALDTWRAMKAKLREDGVFIKAGATRDFGEARGGNTQNPMMHLFEALLELSAATGSKEVRRDAEESAGAIFGRLYRREAGFLPELYARDWTPLPEADGGRVEIGHQFEWAYLLSLAVETGFPSSYLDIGNRLIDYGLRTGYDRRSGGIWSRADYSGRVMDDRRKGWWEQCEFLRAIMHYAVRRGRDDLWEPYRQSIRFVQDQFLDAEYGGWYGAYVADGPLPEGQADKGTEWRAGYHTTNLYSEALRLTDRQ